MTSKAHWILALLIVFVAGSMGQAQEYPIPPDDAHQRLQKNVGVWDADITVWMQGPDSEPMKSKGVEKVRMFGELWNITDLEFDFMGSPALGHGMMGYDPSTKKYVGNWQEAGSPYPSSMQGDFDEESGKFTFFLKGKDMAGNSTDMKIVSWHDDDSHRTFQMYTRTPGAEDYVQTLEIKYSKQ